MSKIKKVILLVLLVLTRYNCPGQINALSGEKMFFSPNPKTDPGVTEDNMIRLDFSSLFSFFSPADDPHGIKAIVLSGGRVDVKVYAYNSDAFDGRGELIYSIYSLTTSSDYTRLSNTIMTQTFGDSYQPGVHDVNALFFRVPFPGDDIKGNAQRAKLSWPEKCFRYRLNSDSYITWLVNLYKWGTIENCVDVSRGRSPQPVIVEVLVKNAVVAAIKVPGIENPYVTAEKDINLSLLTEGRAAKQKEIFLNPNAHPNYVILAAHRGYYKDAPENSLEAVSYAMKMGVDMVEIDVKMTKDNKLVLAHDFHLGRLCTRPSRFSPPTYVDDVQIKDLTLAEIRPDLYGNLTQVPVQLYNQHGKAAEKMPTLEEALLMCKGKILVDVDKLLDQAYFEELYKLAESTGTLNQIIVKARPDKISLDQMMKFNLNWKNWLFTPIYFSDSNIPEGFTTNIDTYLNDDRIVCPGVELNYRSEDDPLVPFIATIRQKNKRVIAFPQWPEGCEGNFTPGQKFVGDVDLRTDKRINWDWLLGTSARRPDMLISDRLEVLLEYLEKRGLRRL